MPYEVVRLGQFDEDLAAFKPLQKLALKRIGLVSEAPYKYSHSLGKGRWADLTGLRGAYVQGTHYVAILAICEECIRNGYEKLNQRYCREICTNQSVQQVVFIAFGVHDKAYGKH